MRFYFCRWQKPIKKRGEARKAPHASRSPLARAWCASPQHLLRMALHKSVICSIAMFGGKHSGETAAKEPILKFIYKNAANQQCH
jgi:hypothetical protein